MFDRYKAVRVILKLATFLSPVQEVVFCDPQERFLIIPRLPEDPVLKAGLVNCYKTIFGEPPWEEKWSEEEVLAKLGRELTGNSFLVILRGNKEIPVAGFCWGKILRVSDLEEHIEPALGERPVGLEKCLLKKNKGDERILYFHEFAILRRFRRGLNPLRFLLRPSLEFGWIQGVNKTLFWSTPQSKIFPLALYMGYMPISRIQVKGKEIVFLFSPDFSSLLKVAQRINERNVARFMRFASRAISL